MPASWLIYVIVQDLDQSLEACAEQGATVRSKIRTVGGDGGYAIIEDPAGAVLALFEKAQLNPPASRMLSSG